MQTARTFKTPRRDSSSAVVAARARTGAEERERERAREGVRPREWGVAVRSMCWTGRCGTRRFARAEGPVK